MPVADPLFSGVDFNIDEEKGLNGRCDFIVSASNIQYTIEAPVLVVSAQDDQLTPPTYADVLEKTIKNATRTHIMDAGHVVPIEKPVEVNQAILEFLDRNGL